MTNGAQATTAQVPRKKQNQFYEVWKRFKRNPVAMVGLGIMCLQLLMAATAGIIAPATIGEGGHRIPGYNQQDWSRARQFPSAEHIMGTDDLGRDIFHRILHGSRVSLQIGALVVTISMTIGVTLGALAGFYPGAPDNIIMRIVDIILAVPNILLAIAIAAAIGGGLYTVMIAVGVGAIPSYARITKAQVLAVKEQEFVEAARSVGAGDFRLVRKHILPNCIAPIIVEATMGMAGAILAAAGLSFIGIGIEAPLPEWGAMLAGGRRWVLAGYWHMTVFPGLAIALIIFGLNMMGDGLRDALDPKLRSSGVSKRKFARILRARGLMSEKQEDK